MNDRKIVAQPVQRGVLRNGNPGGDFQAAPRCGAKTRNGAACRGPAMRNGRCRLHGGLSTAPKTPEGRIALLKTWSVHEAGQTRAVGIARTRAWKHGVSASTPRGLPTASRHRRVAIRLWGMRHRTMWPQSEMPRAPPGDIRRSAKTPGFWQLLRSGVSQNSGIFVSTKV
jgi:hypothetical protein